MKKTKRLLAKHVESGDPELHVTPLESLEASNRVAFYVNDYLESFVQDAARCDTCTIVFRIVEMDDDEVMLMEAES